MSRWRSVLSRVPLAGRNAAAFARMCVSPAMVGVRRQVPLPPFRADVLSTESFSLRHACT
jgi:hypothetical protein